MIMKNFMRFVCLVMVLCLCVASVASAAVYSSRYGDNTLKRSSTVKRVVKNVQADFTRNTNYTLDHDGKYGPMTFAAAKEFQEDHYLDVDGQTGKYTKTELYPLRDKRYNY